jgi:hypothetical protein
MTRKQVPLSALADAAMTRRSPLYTWMMVNHDAFNAIVKEAVRPNWAKLAEEFANNGLTDGEGKPPTDECTRQTWWRVRKAVAARRAAAAKRTPPKTAQPVTKPTEPVRAPEQEPDDDDGFKFKRLKL